jgi:hypothetical protein
MFFGVLEVVLGLAQKKFVAAATADRKSRDGRECALSKVMSSLFYGYARPIRFVKSRNFSYILRYSIPFSVSFREVSS